MNQSKSHEKEYFLDDRPIENLQEEDAFGHLYYAKALFQILEKSPERTSESIGLFGKWGVGKTSIINELTRMLRKSGRYSDSTRSLSYSVVVVDAWQYSRDNFRREFLLDLAEEFGCEAQIKKKLTRSEEATKMRSPELTWGLAGRVAGQSTLVLISALVVAVAGYLAATFLLGLTGIPEDTQEQLALLIALLFGIPAVFIENIKSSLSSQPIVERVQPAVHADEFRDLFQFIVTKKAKLKADDRLVIVVDNLDRVAEEIVLEVLASVKTFLDRERCIYILPCDHEGLKHHIRSSRLGAGFSDGFSDIQATEYLRKFFKTTLTVREFLTEDLQHYITNVLARMKILDLEIPQNADDSDETSDVMRKRNRHEVATVFRVAAAKDPRRIIQLANKLTANYLLAEEKKSIDANLFANISSHLGFLAKLTVLEERWPSLYKLIVEYPRVASAISDELISGVPDAPPKMLDKYLENDSSLSSSLNREWNSGLKQFLQGTNFILAPHVSDFVHFRQRPSVDRISNFYLFRDALLNANSADVEQVLGDSSTEIEAALNVAANELSLYAGLEDQSTVANICISLVQIFKVIPEDRTSLREELANELAQVLSRTSYLGIAMRIDTPSLLQILAVTHKSRWKNRSEVLFGFCASLDFESEKDASYKMLESLLRSSSMLGSRHYQRIKTRIKVATENSSNLPNLRNAANLAIELLPGQVKLIVPQELLVQHIQLLGSREDASKEAAEFLTVFLTQMTKGTLETYSARLIQLLSSPAEPPSPDLLQGLQVVNTHAGKGMNPSHLLELVKHLSTNFGSLASQEHKEMVVRAYLALLPRLNEESQNEFRPQLNASIASASPQHLMDIIEILQSNRESVTELDQLVENVRVRAATHHGSKEVRVAFFSLASDTGNEDEITEYVQTLASNPSAVIPSLEDSSSVLKDAALRPVLKAALNLAHSFPDSHLENTLITIGTFAGTFTESYMADITEILLNKWMIDQREAARRAALGLWNSYKDKTSAADIARFYRRTLENASQHVTDSTIWHPENRLYLEVLRDNFDDLRADIGSEYIDVLIDAREQGREEQVREVGYAFIGSLKADPFDKSSCFKELMDDLKAETNPGQLRNIIEALTKHKEHLTSKQISAVRELLTSDDIHEVLKPYVEIWD